MNATDMHLLPQNLDRDYPVIVRGEGCVLYDSSGASYLDGAAGGVSACCVGHGVMPIVDAMAAQAGKLAFASLSMFTTEPQQRLAEELVNFAPAGTARAYFVSTGTEATELCVKLARSVHLARGEAGRTRVISRWHGYHGSSLGALAYSGRSSRRHLLAPYFFPASLIPPPYCYRCPWGRSYPECDVACAWELDRAIKREGPQNVSLFIAEPFINTVGAAGPPPEYFPLVREICDRHGVLLAIDEVITGFGRTGRNFAIEHWGVRPDLIACGKGIAGGYAPLAAALVSEAVCEALLAKGGETQPGYTYAGNPVSCAAGLATLAYIQEHGLIARAAAIGEVLQAEARSLLELPLVGDVRGKGLMLGIEFVQDKQTKETFPRAARVSEQVHAECWRRGLSYCPLAGDADGISGDAASIGPALIITEAQVRELVRIFGEVVVAIAEKLGLA
jgi:adenosylmethionine-8-amino-7-oxononanoate aminotransferase